jgi:hypothetical protein
MIADTLECTTACHTIGIRIAIHPSQPIQGFYHPVTHFRCKTARSLLQSNTTALAVICERIHELFLSHLQRQAITGAKPPLSSACHNRTDIALAKFRHVGQFQSRIISHHPLV